MMYAALAPRAAKNPKTTKVPIAMAFSAITKPIGVPGETLVMARPRAKTMGALLRISTALIAENAAITKKTFPPVSPPAFARG